jgi:hypothetical protein
MTRSTVQRRWTPEWRNRIRQLNGACFGIGAGLGIALVAPIAAAGKLADYRTAMWISVGITAVALLASLWVQGPIEHDGEKI